MRTNLALVARGRQVWIRVVSEVVYVRSLDVAIQAKAHTRAEDDLHPSELDDDPKANGEQEPAAQTAADADPALDPHYAAFVRADVINRKLMDSDADDVPGGFVRFITVTDDSVTIRRFWQRGIAIAVRAITLEVDSESGEVLHVRRGPTGQHPRFR